MKKQILIVLSVITGLLAACSTANFAYYDDIYTSSGEKAVQKAAPRAAQTPAPAEADGTTMVADSIIYETDENGNLLRTLTYYPGSSEPVVTYYTKADSGDVADAAGGYDPDDYYDYCYSSRIRRFHHNYGTCWGYYDPCFTNLYWYDNCPASWGISIYLGYNWWWPNYYYRPYYYSPYWYDYGFRYGWGWYGPYPHHPYYGPWHPHHHPGYEPVSYYHNHRDPNHTYYYGHRNNIGPSVGNGDRGELPEGRGNAGGASHGNGETNNHYSVTSSPVAFNQRYDNMVAGATGMGSANNNSVSTTASTRVSDANSSNPIRTYDPTNTLKPANGNGSQPTNSRVTEKPVNSAATSRQDNTARTDAAPTASGASATSATPTTSRPATTGTTTITRPATAASSQSTKTVTRTVVTPSSVNTRPAATSGNRPTTTTRPSSSTSYPSGTYNSRPSSSSTNRPSSNTPSRNNGSSYSRPSSSSTPSSRSNYNSPSSNSRPSSSSNNSRSNYNSRPSSSSSSSSRSSYSSPSSSSRSSYSSGSSRSSGGSFGGGGRSGGGGSHSSGRR